MTNNLLLTLLVGACLASAEYYSGSLATNGSPTQTLKLLGRWHHGPVYTGLRILDVSDRSGIREIGHVPTYRSLGVHVSGPYAYVADDFQGMRVIDIANGRSITWVFGM